jgi:phospholipase C
MASINHVFVLMLENRSFDHLLGFSGLTGVDAVTGAPTQIDAPPPGASNSWSGKSFPAGPPPVDPMTVDPYHEFPDVLEHLCGPGAAYRPGGPYPPINRTINNSGFVSNFAAAAKASSPADVMGCFTPARLPVLCALAKEFAVCDSWFCSMPGPTFPNRFFALGASSAELDHSPTSAETLLWQTIDGFKFQNGSVFEAGRGFFSFLPWKRKLKWRIYAGNTIFTLAHALQGIHIWDITRYSKFAGDIGNPNYDAEFTWIEPNYGHVTSDYLGGNSQHPLDGVTGGEALIRATYEAIRNSPLWESSMFIITWDEHGGYYDHVAPQPAIPPGDQAQFSGANRYGFAFDRYGPRVPAVIISPLIPRNTIDHRVYDHTSLLATVERLFGLRPLTARDRAALDLRALASLPVARNVQTDLFALPPEAELAHRQVTLDTLEIEAPPPTRPNEPVDHERNRNLPGFIHVVARTDRELPPPGVPPEAHGLRVRERVTTIRTRGDAHAYFEEVRRKTAAYEAGRR